MHSFKKGCMASHVRLNPTKFVSGTASVETASRRDVLHQVESLERNKEKSAYYDMQMSAGADTPEKNRVYLVMTMWQNSCIIWQWS